MSESAKKSWRRALDRVMEQQRQLPEPDYSLPAFNDPARLHEFMHVLDINQSDLAGESGVSQSFISALLRGAENFSEPSRTAIWRTLNRLQLEKIERDLKKKGDEGSSGDLAPGWASLREIGLFKTPIELKDEEIGLLTKERDSAREQLRLTKQLLDMNLVDRCIELEKRLAEALTANAEYAKLFALKGAAVAGDELQEAIERRMRKGEQ